MLSGRRPAGRVPEAVTAGGAAPFVLRDGMPGRTGTAARVRP
ncbi:hypothetical protein [Actinocorallia populi]|nr:hypothetical protein [Actinocorallia populi]